MSRRRRKTKEIEVLHLIEHPPQLRAKREANRVLELLDRLDHEKPNREARTA